MRAIMHTHIQYRMPDPQRFLHAVCETELGRAHAQHCMCDTCLTQRVRQVSGVALACVTAAAARIPSNDPRLCSSRVSGVSSLDDPDGKSRQGPPEVRAGARAAECVSGVAPQQSVHLNGAVAQRRTLREGVWV
jgi:hypothetical protein